MGSGSEEEEEGWSSSLGRDVDVDDFVGVVVFMLSTEYPPTLLLKSYQDPPAPQR
jgi:hypothetical protein